MQLYLLVDIDIKSLEDLLGYACPVDEIPTGLCCDCESARHGNADVYHLTQAGTFAAHEGKIVLPHILQPNNRVHAVIYPI